MSADVDTSTVRPAFSISPPVAGTFIMADNSPFFAFRPDSVMAANTAYTVTLSTSLKSKTGVPIHAPYLLYYSTGN
jgi:hypothetical protein